MSQIHKLSDVQSLAIGEGTSIWQFTVILPRAVIGRNCNIGANCFVENDVRVGDNVTIKNGVQLWDGVVIEDSVFIGPNASFTNVLFPRSVRAPKKEIKVSSTVIKRGATIGANATVVCGITIGEYAFVGAGSVVTRDVPPFELWFGNPARFRGKVDEGGNVLVSASVTTDNGGVS